MSTDCNMIHETVVKDIVDVITDVKNAENLPGFLRGRQTSFRSIASASDNLTLVFPVICTRNMDISNAAMVSKAIERRCVSMLQMLFSSIAYCDVDNAKDYISRFHTNIKFSNKVDMDELIDITDKILSTDESATLNKYEEKAIEQALIADRDRYKNKYVPDSISESSINDYKIMNNYYGNMIVKDTTAIEEARRDPRTIGINNTAAPGTNDSFNNNGNRFRNSLNTTINNYNGGGFNGGGNNNREASAKDYKDTVDFFRGQILDSDVKKANELIPTSMVINFTTLAEGNPINTSCVIGVKAKLYVADSMDIIDHLVSKHVDNNKLNKFVRATTREISFWKDFVFAIDKARFDAKSSADSKSSAKMWRVLERRSKKSKIRRALGTKNDASAITTLVVNQEEIEYIKKNSNIDLDNASVMRKIMESYNLMCFVIVDEVNETVKFLFDTGDDNYETLPFSGLERESSDNTYKKVINLMTKMR